MEYNLYEETNEGSNKKTIEVETTDQEKQDTINDEVKTIYPTSGTDTHKNDNELIISPSSKNYDDLVKGQWTLNDNIEEMLTKVKRKLLLKQKIVTGNRERGNKQLEQQ